MSTPRNPSKAPRRDRGEILIGIFKLLKAILVLALAFGALSLVHRDVQEVLAHRFEQLGVDPGNRYIHHLLVQAGLASPGRIKVFTAGFFFYGAIFAIEGVGLLLAKRWAEYFTAIVTGSFLPWEIYSISRHPDNLKAIVIALNIATVIYLIVRIRKPLKHE
ncbi:MAG: DUF2127 domain-containing protein [Bacteroidota bacterium]|nr:DUF2127 domain-containing protein [Bacteroidota bacterium]MDP4231889.1 DUF2127 domain-containing protein [Bacteroidota bacterium]MDP4241404.1 DUF2127 domain-containing protein [Bacteroidota bacterium]MDP4287327.1 DUF2127 domain-containing protein [Bacteroidota bacterium]